MSKLSISELDNLYEDEGAKEPCVGCGNKKMKKNTKTLEKVKKFKKNGE
jgi:hypothetical protein